MSHKLLLSPHRDGTGFEELVVEADALLGPVLIAYLNRFLFCVRQLSVAAACFLSYVREGIAEIRLLPVLDAGVQVVGLLVLVVGVLYRVPRLTLLFTSVCLKQHLIIEAHATLHCLRSRFAGDGRGRRRVIPPQASRVVCEVGIGLLEDLSTIETAVARLSSLAKAASFAATTFPLILPMFVAVLD